MPDTPTAETAVTIAQIMSLIIRPCYPRYGRPAVQNCTEHMEKCPALQKGSICLRLRRQNGEYVNMLSKGIIDPTKVVRSALQNAASVGLRVVDSAVVR